MRFIRSLFSGEEDDGDSITVSLPSFMDDDLGSMDVSGYGKPDTILYTFKVWNHRTEGRLHINKRDLELHRADGDRSYGLTQGMPHWRALSMACLRPRISFTRMANQVLFITRMI